MLEESTVETVILLFRRMMFCRGITENFAEYGRGFQAASHAPMIIMIRAAINVGEGGSRNRIRDKAVPMKGEMA